jgi:hypothetical protein
VQVENSPLSNDLTLVEYANETIPVLREGTTYFNLVNSIPATISGIHAHILAYEYTFEGDNYRGIDVMSITDRKVYYISFVTERSKYTAYLPELQKIFESLRIMADGISDEYGA